LDRRRLTSPDRAQATTPLLVLRGDAGLRGVPGSPQTASAEHMLPPAGEEFWALTEPGMRMCWPPAQGAFAPAPAPAAPGAPQLLVVTVISDDMRHFPSYSNFLFSARKLGFSSVMPLPVAPMPRGSAEAEDAFWLRRSETLVHYLRKLPPDMVVMMVDNLDVLFAQGPDEILGRFGRLGKDIVFGAEMLCDTSACRGNATLRGFMEKAAPEDAPLRFLNAGNAIGRNAAMIALFEEVLHYMRQYRVDDQTAVVHTWFRRSAALTLDYESAIFGVLPQSCAQFQQLWVQEETASGATVVRSKASGKSPAVWHFAGMRLADPGFFDAADFLINPCQNFLAGLYDGLGQTLLSAPRKAETPVPRVVISLTTTPHRLPKLRATLESLVNQTFPVAKVYLNIPKYSKRFQTEYVLPLWMAEVAVHVNWCEDKGPATKLLPTLELERDPDTLLITADDDMVYSPKMAQDLVKHMLDWPHCAYCYAGQIIEDIPEQGLYGSRVTVRSADTASYNRHPHAVDVLEAFLGAIYRREFFDDRIQSVGQECWSTDDIWFSQHLAEKGIPRIKLPQKGEDRPRVAESDAITPLRSNNVFGVRKNDVCASVYAFKFKQMWHTSPQPCPIRFAPLDTQSKHGATWMKRVTPAWEYERQTSPCNDNRDAVGHAQAHFAKGQHMGPTKSSLASPSLKHELVVLDQARLCARRFEDGSFSHCMEVPLEEGVVPAAAGASGFVAFHEDGRLCMYRGSAPHDNQGQLWCTAIDECQGRPCRLTLCDDLTIQAVDGSSVLWYYDLVAKGAEKAEWPEACVAESTINIKQPLEKGWFLTNQHRLLARNVSSFAYLDSSGNLCTGPTYVAQRSRCYPGVSKQAVKEEDKVLAFEPDGHLCAYVGSEVPQRWQGGHRGALWCKHLPACVAEACAVHVQSGGSLEVLSASGALVWQH